MNRQWAVQIFSLLAIVAGALISYFPPARNAEAMWTLIGSFLGYGIRDLFGSTGLVSTFMAASEAPAPAVPPSGQGGFARMPLLILVALIALAALMLPGCATTAASSGAVGAPVVAQTPAQIAARACPALTVTVTNLQGLVGLSDAAQANLANAHQIVDVVCGVGAVVDLSSLQKLLETGIPALQDLVRGAGLPDAEANTLLIDLSVAQVVLAGLVDPLLVAP